MDEKGNISTNTMEIYKIWSQYYNNLCQQLKTLLNQYSEISIFSNFLKNSMPRVLQLSFIKISNVK